MSNDPKTFDYNRLINREWPPANRTPNPEEVADNLRQGPARQVPRDQVAPTLAPSAVPSSGRAQTKVWVAHDGSMERICDMNPHRLLGVLAMLKRAGEVHRLLKMVAVLDGGDNSYDLGPEVTLESIVKSSWREHVPRQDMFLSRGADWQRRYGAQPWDTQPSDPSVHTLGSQVDKLIQRLSSPEKAQAASTAARANRNINI